ncbi:cell polarity [Pyrrhoderma noxium]|uniref:Cell polarity n=1 Tax=Pyrrhoderma noxium TaxID=2282107 RepID=A0A286UX17_9AGAM|nr:cell polarity [Pyrrhoderma noxium]
MKRTPSARAPSPTNTTYSGISNYRSDQYKPLRDKARIPSGPIDPKAVAKIHYDEMSTYLENHLAKEPANARASAREKLTRLTRQQFQELSTDVYDELLRRKNNMDNEVPFLPVRDDFHPKRNQARQKLATLPKSRFKDLSGDVFHELGRRYPEFREPEIPADPTSPTSNYDDLDVPSPDFPQANKGTRVTPVENTRRPSEDFRRRPSEDAYGNRSEDGGFGTNGRRPSEDAYGGRESSYSYSSRRKPSQDIAQGLRGDERRQPSLDISLGRRSGEDDRDQLARRPSGSVSTTSDSTNATNAQREMIIPNKSTIAEEEIEVPYGRERESSSTAMGGARISMSRSPDARSRSPELRADTDDGETDPSNTRSAGGLGGLSGLSARLRDRTLEEEEEDGWGSGGAGRTGPGGRSSTTMNAGRASRAGGSVDIDIEGLRREYEYKIATMQTRISSLERSLEESDEKNRRLKEDSGDEKEKIKLLEEELKGLREKEEDQDISMRELKRELNTLRQDRLDDQERATRSEKEDKEQIEALRIRCERLENERMELPDSVNSETVEQLRSDFEGLLSELADLQHRNDELMISKESDLSVINNLNMQLKEYKRKYETARTELRSFKATSQLFLKAPKSDVDQLPMSFDGGLLDIHVTAFVTAIDSLLAAGRSPSTSQVLSPMKSVVNAVSAVIDDVRTFERRQDRVDIDFENVRALRERTQATLSNLVTASKTHATSMGMSPVSLLDAAASHLSASVTELGRTISIRKATKIEQDHFETSASSGSYGMTGYDNVTFKLNWKLSPPLFDQSRSNATASDDSAVPEGPDEAWAELKPYLDAQSESIVYAIQNVLSTARNPIPSPSLNENLTQIITIVSSIVA